MIEYKIEDKEGWEIKDNEFENVLNEIYPDYKIADTRNLSKTTMKVYGIYENNQYLGQINATYRQDETQIIILGHQDEIIEISVKMNSNFVWNNRCE